MADETTMKFFTNLDRSAIEAKLREVRASAEQHKLTEVANLLTAVEGKSRDDLDMVIQKCLAALRGAPEHKVMAATLEMLQINLPNLK